MGLSHPRQHTVELQLHLLTQPGEPDRVVFKRDSHSLLTVAVGGVDLVVHAGHFVDLLDLLVDHNHPQLKVASAEQLEIIEEVGDGQQPPVVGELYPLLALSEGNVLGQWVLLLLPGALLELESVL